MYFKRIDFNCSDKVNLFDKLVAGEAFPIRLGIASFAKPLKNIKNVVESLHEHNIKCIVITVGPKQVAKVVCDIWGFDGYYGSDYEVLEGVFTGKILNYIGVEQKIECLQDFCKYNSINSNECIAVGDGSTDIPIFEYCGKSIAINSSPKVRKSAMYAVDTDDLTDILKYILCA